MNTSTKRIALFGLLTALAIVLGWVDSQFPLLNGMMPGFKLGLSNTVILFAVYLMDLKSSILMTVIKVSVTSLITGLRFPALWLNISGATLSLLAMLAIKNKGAIIAMMLGVLAMLSEAVLFIQHPYPKGEWLLCAILIPVGSIACMTVSILIRKGIIHEIQGTSIGGAVAHNIGQTVAYCIVMKTPQLLITYLPLLVGIGAVTGFLTGIITERVLKVLKMNPQLEGKR